MTNSINKGFLLYKDSLEVVDQLTDQQAGKLFKAILLYQKTGNVGDIDQITKFIITPLLSQFTRDEEKYKNSILQGKLGNLKKYHNDIYLRIVAEELTIEEAENLAYPDKKVLGRPPITPDQVGSHKERDNDTDKDKVKITITTKKPEMNNSQFEQFWNLYDKKIGRAEVEKKFKLALKKVSFEKLIEGLNRYISKRGNDSQFWKHPTTWLNAESWNDEYSQPTQNDQTLCQAINNLAGSNLILKIEKNGGAAALYFKNEADFESLKKLSPELREEIKKTIGDKMGTLKLEFKF
jgi:hypothetical protein